MTTNTSSIEDLLSDAGKAKLTGKEPAALPSPAQKSAKKKTKAALPEETEKDKLAHKLGDIEIGEEEAKVRAAAAKLGFPYIDLTGFPVGGEALQTIPENICNEDKVICFVNTGEQIRLGSIAPDNAKLEKIKSSLEESLHAQVEMYMISERCLKMMLDQYARLPKYVKPAAGVQIKEGELEKFKKIATNFKSLEEEIGKVNISDLVALIIAASIVARSSDIHIEAEEKDVKVRFRVDGILHDAASIDKAKWPQIISRIKLLSGLKININDKPQDGRFTIKLTKDKIDVRVSTIPTTWGESVVMRLLQGGATQLQFEDMGLIGQAAEKLKFQVERPNGMIITSGPTGSGKTTTLYDILNKLNVEGVKIITMEDPIEYKLEGVNQSQIDHSKGYSFADGLRSILRQDPDVIMVGELRDLETADVSINAALTGHLVISTIHTNSAAGAIPRFLAMGVKPFLLAPALNAIMGQRLVRRICEKCKKEIKLEDKDFERAKKILEEIPEGHPDRPDLNSMKFYAGSNEKCEACNGLGYKGRVGIYEILIMTPEIEKVILGGQVSEYDMQAIAVKAGMITMAHDGLIKAMQGITTVEEVFRVSE
ncbi:MAG: GspE/PulE family protein [Parcubacteria group bacterium]